MGRWMAGLAHRGIRNYDVVFGNAAAGEEVDIIPRTLGRIADGQGAHGDAAIDQHAGSARDRRVRSGALKGLAMDVVNMRRAIDTDRDPDSIGFEAVEPRLVDQDAVGGDGDRQRAAGARRNAPAGLADPVKVIHPPQQRLAAMQNEGKFNKVVADDMLFDAPQQLLQHIVAHQLGFVVNRNVAEPVAVRAIYIASCCYLHE